MATGIAALVCASICGFIATFVNFEMIDLVNAKLPKDEQFERAWWYLDKALRLRREYKRFYPRGRHIQRIYTLEAVMFGCGIVSAWAFGFLVR